MSCCGVYGNGQPSAPSSDVPSIITPSVLIDDIYPELATSDFVALGNVNVVINGRTWRIVNSAAAQVFGNVLGTGLRYNAPAANSDWISSTRTAATIAIGWASIPGFDVRGSYLIEFALASSTQANGDRVCMTAFLDTTGTDLIGGGGRRTTAAGSGPYVQSGTNLTNPPDSTGASTDDAFCLLMTPAGFNAFSGEYDFAADEFPSVYPRAAGQFVQAIGTGPTFDIAQDPGYPTVGAGLCLSFPNTTGAAGTHDETVHRLRLSRVA